MKKGFSAIDLCLGLAVFCIFIIVLVPVLHLISKTSKEKTLRLEQTTLHVGDVVYITHLNATGILNTIPCLGNSMGSIIIKGTNDIPVVIENINFGLLKKTNPIKLEQ